MSSAVKAFDEAFTWLASKGARSRERPSKPGMMIHDGYLHHHERLWSS